MQWHIDGIEYKVLSGKKCEVEEIRPVYIPYALYDMTLEADIPRSELGDNENC